MKDYYATVRKARDYLATLGLDLTDPEARQVARDALLDKFVMTDVEVYLAISRQWSDSELQSAYTGAVRDVFPKTLYPDIDVFLGDLYTTGDVHVRYGGLTFTIDRRLLWTAMDENVPVEWKQDDDVWLLLGIDHDVSIRAYRFINNRLRVKFIPRRFFIDLRTSMLDLIERLRSGGFFGLNTAYRYAPIFKAEGFTFDPPYTLRRRKRKLDLRDDGDLGDVIDMLERAVWKATDQQLEKWRMAFSFSPEESI